MSLVSNTGLVSLLDSWKEIAAHVRRDVRTVQRWEKCEGLPVHRHRHSKRHTVYALAEEIDAWLISRRSVPDDLLSNSEMPKSSVPTPLLMEKNQTRSRVWLALVSIVGAVTKPRLRTVHSEAAGPCS